MTDERDTPGEPGDASADNFWDRLQSLPEDTEHDLSVHEDEAYWHEPPPQADGTLLRPSETRPPDRFPVQFHSDLAGSLRLTATTASGADQTTRSSSR